MKPYFDQDGITIWNSDCREVLPHVGRFGAVVTDPPFGIGFKYESHDDSPKGYAEFVWGVAEACEAVCLPGSPLFFWQSATNIRLLHEWFPREWRLFPACKNFVQMRPTEMQWAWDPVLVWWTPGERYALGTDSRDYDVGDTNPSSREDARGHPCPRPLSTVLRIVQQWCRPTEAVIDPFLGSGTTLVACKKLGIRGVGIEKEEKYAEIAVKRILNTTPSLFSEER